MTTPKTLDAWIDCNISKSEAETDKTVFDNACEALSKLRDLAGIVGDKVEAQLMFVEDAFEDSLHMYVLAEVRATQEALSNFESRVSEAIQSLDEVSYVKTELGYDGQLALATLVPLEVLHSDKLRDEPFVHSITLEKEKTKTWITRLFS